MNSPREITVRSLRYDKTVRKTWTAKLVNEKLPLLELVGKFRDDHQHPNLGFLPKGLISHEYYWLDRWYNVFRFHEHTGKFRNFYCNVAMPAIFDSAVLEYVDLDIDVIVWPGGKLEILDRDDFEASSRSFGYSDEIKFQAESALDELLSMISFREFPFDQEVLDLHPDR